MTDNRPAPSDPAQVSEMRRRGEVSAAQYLQLERAAGQAMLIAASVLTGVLFAVIGQVYQTGADAWELFVAWTLLILPWVLASTGGRIINEAIGFGESPGRLVLSLLLLEPSYQVPTGPKTSRQSGGSCIGRADSREGSAGLIRPE